MAGAAGMWLHRNNSAAQLAASSWRRQLFLSSAAAWRIKHQRRVAKMRGESK